MRSLIFDTETTGFFDKYKPLDWEGQPDVIQLACLLLDEETNLVVHRQETLIFTEQEITPGAFKAHGITHEELRNFGVVRRAAMAMFNNILKQSDQIVSHNLDFDIPIMQIGYLREGFGASQFDQKRRFCTMQNSTDICKIPNPKRPGSYKWPSMQEAYKILVNSEGFKGAHRAMADAQACLSVYRKLKGLPDGQC
jgi:DNA polymerase-3 subunit epsilon